MAPRKRPKKVGLKRIDAAIDAMGQLGFSKDRVVKAVNELLKVYGGDEGWTFIEEGPYKVLIEKILEEDEEEMKKLPSGHNDSWKDISCVDHSTSLLLEQPKAETSGEPGKDGIPQPRRQPCYGWISESESEEEEDNVRPHDFKVLKVEG